MSAPKKPQDHLEKAEKPKVEPVDGGRKVTLGGLTVTVMDDALDDFELLEDLGEIQLDGKKQAGRLPRILRQLIGDDYQTVMDGLRGENGRVSVGKASEWIKALFEAINPNS